ncbi:hypothetical protein IKS57_01750 [bacterium]|nr:hypothetical protein [bacterium]
MNISPIANDLVQAIEEYIEQSSKVGYRFTLEEQLKLQQMIKVLNNQIDMLVDYEAKRECK